MKLIRRCCTVGQFHIRWCILFPVHYKKKCIIVNQLSQFYTYILFVVKMFWLIRYCCHCNYALIFGRNKLNLIISFWITIITNSSNPSQFQFFYTCMNFKSSISPPREYICWNNLSFHFINIRVPQKSKSNDI